DGRVTSTANAVTSLQGSVSSIEKGLSTKADASALNNYYTKTEADSAASGAIDKFNSQLTIGGVNVVANSEAPRTSTAATNREYLLYERSAELKAFYDENLEKPITISFEMSVPVAGPVQVYSSNGSAHQFVTSVNAIIVNQFAKYSVTVSQKRIRQVQLFRQLSSMERMELAVSRRFVNYKLKRAQRLPLGVQALVIQRLQLT
ncbi:hypothetical protein J945_4283, partial [Acinetobacter baumannii 25878_2]